MRNATYASRGLALFLGLLLAWSAPPTALARGEPPIAIDARPFPRDFTAEGTEFHVHQPQVERWEGEELSGRFVVSVKTGIHSGPDGKSADSLDYGVVWFSARTQVDTGARAVVLTDLAFDRASFPTAADKQDAYLARVRTILDDRKSLVMSLDQLEAALAIAAIDADMPSLPVNNDPPDILFDTGAAVLVLVDGEPALKPAGSAGVQRVVNSRSVLLNQNGTWYLPLAGHWLKAASLDGPWSPTPSVAGALVQARDKAVAEKQADALDSPPQDLQDAFADGKAPTVYVRTRAAELITTAGEPEIIAVPGTSLGYVDNTGADVFVDSAADHRWYVLVSGRWFAAASSKGPWTYVAPDALPADFAKIPPDSPKSAVLASIPGTPEARESLIANSIPQTATVDVRQVTLEVAYDGRPEFAPIHGTALEYARNTPVPVIHVPDAGYFAVDKGVWFTADAATGPWRVATAVPTAIYGIPTSSPLHYVTYVRVYGSHDDEVYVGYTPGYYGTVVSNSVVVYGTGYACSPWVGNYWYGCPPTYGMGVYFGWNAWVGWTFGWGWGWGGGWYGPYSPWWGPWYGPPYGFGWWGGGAAAWNVYGHWGNAAVRGTAAAWANPWTGNFGRAARGGYYNEATGGRGVGRAGINTNAYTGTTVAGAQGVRYNPETGRIVSGGAVVAGNPYTDQAAAAARRTTVNTNTGRVTDSAGAAVAGDAGAAGIGGFDSNGNRVDAAGVGGFHYNADSGTLSGGGVVNVNDNVYAGHDGNVYHYDNGEWTQVTRPDGGPVRADTMDAALERDRMARERGNERISGAPGTYARPDYYSRPTTQPISRPATHPAATPRPVGGNRPNLGHGAPRGGFRRR